MKKSLFLTRKAPESSNIPGVQVWRLTWIHPDEDIYEVEYGTLPPDSQTDSYEVRERGEDGLRSGPVKSLPYPPLQKRRAKDRPGTKWAVSRVIENKFANGWEES